MAIVKRPATPAPVPAQSDDQVAERFIQAAPDGSQAQAQKADQDEDVQITLRFKKEQLDRVTAIAKRQGIPRASYIKRAIAVQLAADEKQ